MKRVITKTLYDKICSSMRRCTLMYFVDVHVECCKSCMSLPRLCPPFVFPTITQVWWVVQVSTGADGRVSDLDEPPQFRRNWTTHKLEYSVGSQNKCQHLSCGKDDGISNTLTDLKDPQGFIDPYCPYRKLLTPHIQRHPETSRDIQILKDLDHRGPSILWCEL